MNGTETYEDIDGAPKGSAHCPSIWNIMYDGVLRLQLAKGETVVGFADDIAVVWNTKNRGPK